MRSAQRSGDRQLERTRNYQRFDEYLLPPADVARAAAELPVSTTNVDAYLAERGQALDFRLRRFVRLLMQGKLEGVELREGSPRRVCECCRNGPRSSERQHASCGLRSSPIAFNPSRNALRRACPSGSSSAQGPKSTPMRRIRSGCCARVAIDQAAPAPPLFCRPMHDTTAPTRHELYRREQPNLLIPIKTHRGSPATSIDQLKEDDVSKKNAAKEIRVLKIEEVAAVNGGSGAPSAVSQAIKALGEGISAMARKE